MLKMYPEAYKEWLGIFNDDILETWQKERKELQKVAMLFTALQKELKDAQNNVEIEIINIRQQLKYKDNLVEKEKPISSQNKSRCSRLENKENDVTEVEKTHIRPLEDTIPYTQQESPDLFRNVNPNIQRPSSDASVIDLSLSDDDPCGGSPTIKRRKRHYHKSGNNAISTKTKKAENTPLNKVINCSVKTNLFKTPVLKSDDDISVIENTPEVRGQRSCNLGRTAGISLRKTDKSKTAAKNTLTQMFNRCKKKLEGNTNKNTEDDTDCDETYFDANVEGSKMGITDMLSYINKEDTPVNKVQSSDHRSNDDLTDCELDIDSSQEVDQFSKGGIFDEEDIATPSDDQKNVPIEPEPIVRGKARKQLRGWACEQCKNFYEKMNLTPEELRKRMDECSRHRFKYRPREETLPGFWDLSIPPEKPN